MSNKIRIVDYKSEYQYIFKELNQQWITTHFVMEESDYKSLDNPDSYIINRGGFILVALYDEKPIGVCSLIKMDDEKYDYELAKMAVSSEYRGGGIGKKLAIATLEKAKSVGAKVLFLESNTILETAIHLYRKLGFVEVKDWDSPYQRSNIQMELHLY